MSEKKPWLTDVNVLLIFFGRADTFEKCFEAVRAVRPRRLLLWQDGPRENRPDDLENIKKCRRIAENIDWDCEVYRKYNEKNYGCDPSTFYSHKWAFSIVDKLIVLEDDIVATPDFFNFCREMLDRYEFDNRISRICGMNQVRGFECPDSYFFTSVGSVWGWASWKRVADTWDEDYSFLDDENAMRLMRNYRKGDKSYPHYEEVCRGHKAEGVPHWETVQTYARYFNSQLMITPSKNLIKNIGLGADSTHSNTQLECIPKRIRDSFYGDAESLEFPLKHPRQVIDNVEYKERLYLITGKGHPLIGKKLKLESVMLRIRHKGLGSIFKKFAR
ncbi:MAG: hemolysin activation protein [Clostridia bacterium]|nr:hemolysin activation protein [Clostridia bacterium]